MSRVVTIHFVQFHLCCLGCTAFLRSCWKLELMWSFIGANTVMRTPNAKMTVSIHQKPRIVFWIFLLHCFLRFSQCIGSVQRPVYQLNQLQEGAKKIFQLYSLPHWSSFMKQSPKDHRPVLRKGCSPVSVREHQHHTHMIANQIRWFTQEPDEANSAGKSKAKTAPLLTVHKHDLPLIGYVYLVDTNDIYHVFNKPSGSVERKMLLPPFGIFTRKGENCFAKMIEEKLWSHWRIFTEKASQQNICFRVSWRRV